MFTGFNRSNWALNILKGESGGSPNKKVAGVPEALAIRYGMIQLHLRLSVLVDHLIRIFVVFARLHKVKQIQKHFEIV